MWEYTDKVKDLFFPPKNAGETENADEVGEVGSMIYGDALRLYLKMTVIPAGSLTPGSRPSAAPLQSQVPLPLQS